jgi:hypothetical protein
MAIEYDRQQRIKTGFDVLHRREVSEVNLLLSGRPLGHDRVRLFKIRWCYAARPIPFFSDTSLANGREWFERHIRST